MEKKYFFVMASDGATNFEPTGQYNHKFFGGALVETQAEYDALKARGCRELTKQEYDEEFKKKSTAAVAIGRLSSNNGGASCSTCGKQNYRI